MIIPRSGDIIKHIKFRDTAILIKKVFRLPHKIKITGQYINQGFAKTWPLGVKAKLSISIENLKDWAICMEPDLKCIRQAKWRSLN